MVVQRCENIQGFLQGAFPRAFGARRMNYWVLRGLKACAKPNILTFKEAHLWADTNRQGLAQSPARIFESS